MDKKSVDGGTKGFTEEERAAMKERGRELRTKRSGSRANKDGEEEEVLAKISEMQDSDRIMAERIHEIIKANAPILLPRTWYGMPAYARDGNVVCFFQDSRKFKTRYATLGFSDKANLDEGEMWPNSYALRKLTSVEEARIIELIKKAVQ
ncbi:MAG: DUF1801 domain-containing protein [Candidatus Thermoplasmatota archaeon]|nr:DUF1801 domain-containing protein [Candidatus Thermoplasmatota archaeon]